MKDEPNLVKPKVTLLLHPVVSILSQVLNSLGLIKLLLVLLF